MPRAGLTTSTVVDAALSIVDEQGADALTLAAVAARTGVAAPSLYKHVRNLAELRSLVGARVMEEMTELFSAAIMGTAGDEAVSIMMRSYRAYVVRHPARYAAMPQQPLGEDPALTAAGTRLLSLFLGVLRGYGLSDSMVHTARCLRAIVHGFASLEAGGGFGLPESVDESYEQLIRMVLACLPQAASGARTP